jgi:hypothetical protein
MSIDNLQESLPYCQEPVYIRSMATFDAQAFAEWLRSAFDASRFKSYAQLATEIGISRAYVSSLVGAKEQLLTARPSQPGPDIVIKLAAALGADQNHALRLAGHASSEPSLADIDGEFAALFYESAEWSEENREEAIEMAKIIFKRFQDKERRNRSQK